MSPAAPAYRLRAMVPGEVPYALPHTGLPIPPTTSPTRLVWRGIALAAVAEREVLAMVDRLHRLGAQIAKHTAVAKPHLLNQSFSCCSQAWRSLPGRKIARWALAQARHNNDTGRIRCQSDSFNRRRPPINIRC